MRNQESENYPREVNDHLATIVRNVILSVMLELLGSDANMSEIMKYLRIMRQCFNLDKYLTSVLGKN